MSGRQFTDEERQRGGFTTWLRHGEEHYQKAVAKRERLRAARPAGRVRNLVKARARLAELLQKGRESE